MKVDIYRVVPPVGKNSLVICLVKEGVPFDTLNIDIKAYEYLSTKDLFELPTLMKEKGMEVLMALRKHNYYYDTIIEGD
jgi:hypothetical protein